MTHQNGKIPASDLSTVAAGVQLITSAANAYRALVAQAAHEHVAIKPAGGEGSGYRDIAVQGDFWKADHGDKAMQAKTHHYPTKGDVPVAAPGGSSHGWGDRIDLLFDGSSRPNSVHLNLAKRYGFVREFGSADTNHFEHDGKTAIHGPGRRSYVVQGDDNLTLIARHNGLTLDRLEQLNPQIHDFNLIHPGEKIWLS